MYVNIENAITRQVLIFFQSALKLKLFTNMLTQ